MNNFLLISHYEGVRKLALDLGHSQLTSEIAPPLSKLPIKLIHRDQTSPLPLFFPGNVERDYYKDMLEMIGFLDVRSEREELPLTFNDELDFREKLFRERDTIFYEPPQELRDEFQRIDRSNLGRGWKRSSAH
ncbi:uncharacterized protein TNIN_76831 [Trichonephila inaurata madagascariensis]|uniref:Uncharacterized protein n=1 Tax=Trichonephila inaurata madagascariensis TaxID=2747483 RepID=A0A8X6XB38_9ARAC|nr:uncharacterized protein TNIN_76831 [Trichonephila inaurata madagascariensis]